MRLASRFGRTNQIRRDRPLTREELMQHVPSVFSEDKHDSRSERYCYIPTITLLDNLLREGFHPFLPASHAFVTLNVGNTLNICFAYVGRAR